MYGCESWITKKAEHQRTDAFELWHWKRHLKVPWIEKEIKPINPKGNESWIFIGRTDAEAESPILWPPDKNWLIEKDSDAGKDWRQEEKGITQDGMVGWHHQLNGYELKQDPGVGDGQGSLVCCGPWCHKELDTTDWLKWTELSLKNFAFLTFQETSKKSTLLKIYIIMIIDFSEQEVVSILHNLAKHMYARSWDRKPYEVLRICCICRPFNNLMV